MQLSVKDLRTGSAEVLYTSDGLSKSALLAATHDWLTQLDQKKDVYCVFF